MKTSYFAKYKESNGVSIALSSPKWFKGPSYPDLFPTWDILYYYKLNQNRREYARRYYNEVLKKLDPEKVLLDFDGKVALCFESLKKYPNFCHRILVACWIEKHTGVRVEEFKF